MKFNLAFVWMCAFQSDWAAQLHTRTAVQWNSCTTINCCFSKNTFKLKIYYYNMTASVHDELAAWNISRFCCCCMALLLLLLVVIVVATHRIYFALICWLISGFLCKSLDSIKFTNVFVCKWICAIVIATTVAVPLFLGRMSACARTNSYYSYAQTHTHTHPCNV